MKTLRYILLVAAVAVVAGCTKFDEQPAPGVKPVQGRQVSVGLSLAAVAEQDEKGREIELTRAPNDITDAEEDAVHNVWVFQFGEPVGSGGDGSRPFLWCRYIDEDTIGAAVSGQVPVNLIESERRQLLVFVANTNEPNDSWKLTPGISTLADLRACNIHMSPGEEPISYGGDARNLLMSGAVEAKIEAGMVLDSNPDNGATVDAPIGLVRSLAKVELNLTVDAIAAPNYKVISARLCNVSDRIWFTDALNGHSASELYPQNPGLIDYPAEEDTAAGLANPSQPGKFVWYVPRNTRGVFSNSVAKDKNRYAPAKATYIEVTAMNTANGNEGVVYRIYPGADNCADFNVIPNRRYIFDHNITGNGGDDLTDSRIEQFGKVRCDGHNNSFILNPPATAAMGVRTYEIPITRVNEYWVPNKSEFPGYGGRNYDMISGVESWRVDLLWQDEAGIVREPSAPDLDVAKHIVLRKKTGTGADDTASGDGYFSLEVPAGATHGNFVVAIRKVGIDEVLWSWHFWVTDYNPDRSKFIEVQGDKFVYPVPGGQLERYGGKMWGYDTAGAAVGNNWNNYKYNESSTAVYARKFMMDRPLGTLNNHTTAAQGRGAICYQWGRKDPFPSDIALYNVDGKALTAEAPAGFSIQKWNAATANAYAAPKSGVDVSFGVVNPSIFVSIMSSDWSNLRDKVYLWKDSKLSANDHSAKSIYDPCPPGWRVPPQGVWEDFVYQKTTHNADRGLVYTAGFHYWPDKKVDEVSVRPEGNVFFPRQGYRTNYGALGLNTYYYYSTHQHETSAKALYATGTSLNHSFHNYKASAYFVRCVQQ